MADREETAKGGGFSRREGVPGWGAGGNVDSVVEILPLKFLRQSYSSPLPTTVARAPVFLDPMLPKMGTGTLTYTARGSWILTSGTGATMKTAPPTDRLGVI